MNLVRELAIAATLCGGSAVVLAEPNPRQRHAVTWELSEERTITSLNGGKWSPLRPGLPDASYKYYVDSPGRFRLKVNGGEQYEFNDVTYVYAYRENGVISEIVIQGRGMSMADAIDELKRMHRQWNGEDVGDIMSWRRNVEKGSRHSHNSIIHKSAVPSVPSIWAIIHPDANPPNAGWYIAVKFFWPRERADLDEDQESPNVPPENVVPNHASAVVWDLSKGRSVDALTGGAWTRHEDKREGGTVVYKLDVDSFSLKLNDGDVYEFNDVAHVVLYRRDNEVAEIAVSGREMSERSALESLDQMEMRWREKDDKHVLHSTSIRKKSSIRSLVSNCELEIIAAVLPSLQSPDLRYTQVVFLWLSDATNVHNDAESDDKAKSSQSSRVK